MPVRPRRSMSFALACVAAVTLVTPARADVPDPRFCSADARIIASPDGATPFRVTLRDAANQPLVGTVAILDFTASPGVSLCATADPDHDRRLTAVTGNSTVMVVPMPLPWLRTATVPPCNSTRFLTIDSPIPRPP